MRYFKDLLNEVHAVNDIQSPVDGWIEITKKEAFELSKPKDLTYQQKFEQIDNKRRSLYSQNVDPLLIESRVKRLQRKDSEAQIYEERALQFRIKIQEENPYPKQ